MNGVAVYVHMPFCAAKCSYCDFNSYTEISDSIPEYISALKAEVIAARELYQFTPATVYVGGGTPSLVPAELLSEILRSVIGAGARADEMTLEINPGTVSASQLRALRRLGFDRLSIGVQSFDDGELRLLGRIHTPRQASAALTAARAAGFSNVSLDLMYGFPGQNLGTWRNTLARAIEAQPEHVSLYALTVEPGTALEERIRCGELPAVEDDRAAEMYEFAREVLAEAHYRQYEISNWSRPGYECRHNLVYWRNGDYLGFGAGAWSRRQSLRWGNIKLPREYIRLAHAGEDLHAETEDISQEMDRADWVILGLRLVQGISLAEFEDRFGKSLDVVYGEQTASLKEAGLLELSNGRLKLTPRGQLLGNEVFVRFLPDS